MIALCTVNVAHLVLFIPSLNPEYTISTSGLQVLPCLVEIMRWYDMSLLVNFWSDHLKPVSSMLSYGAALSFLYSVTHAAKLSPLLQDPPDSWQVTILSYKSKMFVHYLCYNSFLEGIRSSSIMG